MAKAKQKTAPRGHGFSLRLPDRWGRCRFCGCDDEHACKGGCAWANKAHTICTRCAPIERKLRRRPGRRDVVDAVYAQASR